VPPISTNTTSALRRERQFAQSVLHLTGHVRDHLHVAAQVAAGALALEHAAVDLPARGEVQPGEVLVEGPLVGAEIHVALGPVVQDEDLAVAKRIQRARVDVEVAFELDGRDADTLVLQAAGQRRAEDALAQAAHHRAEDDDVLGLSRLVARRHRQVELGLT
jgi:hypothetical protein